MPGDLTPADRFDHSRWLRFLSLWMDSVFQVPGTGLRFGLDPLIGLIPVVGDVGSAAVSFYILIAAARLQVPRSTLARMGLNIAIDYVLGAIPLVGNVFDFMWKANDKNMQLLERTLAAAPAERTRHSFWDSLFVWGIAAALLAMLITSVAVAVATGAWIARQVTARG